MKQKTICFIDFFYIRNVTLPLTCIHTAFAKLGGGSAIKIKIHWLFILYCTRLALTLHSKTTQRTHIRK